MKTVTVTLKLQFDVEDSDDESLKEGLKQAFEELDENDELLIGKTKIKVVDHDEEDEDPEFEDEDEEES